MFSPKKRTKRTVKKKVPRKKIEYSRWILPLFLVVLLGLSLAAAAYFIFLRVPDNGRQNREASAAISPPAAKIIKKTAPPDITPEQPAAALPPASLPESKPLPAATARDVGKLPRLAIIIDDMGNNQQLGDSFIDLDLNLTFSFLPYSPATAIQSRKAAALGRDILLHLPMEPKDNNWNPGPGALSLSMSGRELIMTMVADLAENPVVIGVNNHMGSRFTEDRQAMKTLLEFLQENNLLFVDSLTSSDSIGYELARSIGIKTARRDIFLDNEQDRNSIIDQLEKLIALAEKNGIAVGIGHPHPATLEALRDFKEELLNRVQLVGIRELVN